MKLLLTILLVGASSPAVAQPSHVPGDTLSEMVIVERAITASPALRVLHARREAARAESRLTGRMLLEAPELEAETNLGPRILPEADDREQAVSVTQRLELPGVRRARQQAARATLGAAEAAFEADSVGLGLDVRAAVAEASFRQEEATLRARIAADADSLVSVAELRLREGDISELDRNLAVIDAARAAAEAIRADAARAGTLAALAVLVGDTLLAVPRLAALEPLPVDTVAAPSAVRAAELAAAAAEAQAAALRQSARLPYIDVRFGIEVRAKYYEQGDLDADPVVRDAFRRLGKTTREPILAVSIPLPFGSGARLEAEVAAAEATLRAAEAVALRTRIATERAGALARAERLSKAVERFGVAAPFIEENLALLRLAFAGGEIDLPTLLTERSRLVEARLAALEAAVEVRTARLGILRAAAGAPAAGADQD